MNANHVRANALSSKSDSELTAPPKSDEAQANSATHAHTTTTKRDTQPINATT